MAGCAVMRPADRGCYEWRARMVGLFSDGCLNGGRPALLQGLMSRGLFARMFLSWPCSCERLPWWVDVGGSAGRHGGSPCDVPERHRAQEVHTFSLRCAAIALEKCVPCEWRLGPVPEPVALAESTPL